MAARPVAPTVYSVSRTVSAVGAGARHSPAVHVPVLQLPPHVAPAPAPHAPYSKLAVVPAGKKSRAVCGSVGLTGGPPSTGVPSAGSVIMEPCDDCQVEFESA